MYIGIPENEQQRFHNRVQESRDKVNQKHGTYEYPKNKEEYWKVVDEYWVELFSIILGYAPDMIEYVSTPIYVTELKQNRNPELANIFENVWHLVPDNGYIHTIPAWGILCDLCSESHLLSEEPPQ